MLLQADSLWGHGLYDWSKDIAIPLFSTLLSFFAILVAIRALKDNTKVARANYEFQITLSDRDTWRYIIERDLKRIKDPTADANSITEEEKVNTNFIVLNVKTIFEATQSGIIISRERKHVLMKDIGEFFSLPIPSKVWNDVKNYHKIDFQKYIEQCLYFHQYQRLPPNRMIKTLGKFKNWHTVLFKKILVFLKKKI